MRETICVGIHQEKLTVIWSLKEWQCVDVPPLKPRKPCRRILIELTKSPTKQAYGASKISERKLGGETKHGKS